MKHQITDKQLHQFNTMLVALKRISKQFQAPDQLRRASEKQYGLNYTESLEMAYENIQELAKNSSSNVRPLPNVIKSKKLGQIKL